MFNLFKRLVSFIFILFLYIYIDFNIDLLVNLYIKLVSNWLVIV